MDPHDTIDSYVADVVRRLPRGQRRDVGAELRSLLREELTGRAGDLGRAADDAMAMALLSDVGRPQDVADRYRPAGFTVIRPPDAPAFARLALGGVALQWAVTLPAVVAGDASAPGGSQDWLTRLSAWWLSWGLGSFWWPGFLISVTLVAAMVRHRRATAEPAGHAATQGHDHTGAPTAPTAIRRRVLDPDGVNRSGRALALGSWVLGASVLIALPSLPSLAPGLPQPLLNAFTLDAGFLRERAPWLLVLWVASFALELAVLAAGRTSSTVRRISLVIDVAWLGLLTWFLAAGPVFTAAATDGVVRLALLGTIGLVVLDTVATVRRETVPTGGPLLTEPTSARRRGLG